MDRLEGQPEAQFIEENFIVRDHSVANMGLWTALGNVPELVPVGYAPILTPIPKALEQDIDVFIYGTLGETAERI